MQVQIPTKTFCNFMEKVLAKNTAISHYNEHNTEQIVPLGIPCSETYQTILYPTISIGITSEEERTDIAWSFVKTLLTDSFQREFCIDSGSFAIRKDTMQALWRSVTETDSYVDEVVGIVLPYQSDNVLGESLDEAIGPAEKDTVLFMEDLLSSCKRAPVQDYILLNIMTEELTPALYGEKSVDNAVRSLQKRASVYLAE